MNVPSFVDITVEEQVVELRSYFKGLGAEISEELSEEGLTKDLKQIIEVCDLCFRENSDNDMEAVLNSIVSILVTVPPDSAENLILSFCEKTTKAPSNRVAMNCLRCLNNLLNSLDEHCSLCFHIYYHMVKVASQTDAIKSIFTDVDKIFLWKPRSFLSQESVHKELKASVMKWDVSIEKFQRLLRLLHEALLENRHSDLANKVMIELLSTYTEDNASQARDDAHRCIVASLGDPNTFLLDHLLALKPVKFLEGELIHDLLTIFVSEKLSAYLQFYEHNKDFVTSIGLSHDQNMQKMRLLTFMQIAENKKEISFETIQQELKIDAETVEGFVIDLVRTKMVRAKIDQMNKKVVISCTIHRTFGKMQWQQLHEILTTWKSNLSQVHESMQAVLSMQFDQIAGQA